MKSVLSFVALLPLFAACAGADVSDDDTNASGSSDLSVASVTNIEIGRSSGFGPPPPPGGCMAFSRYSVDFNAKELSGKACVDNKPVSVNQSLSELELKHVRTALGQVKQARRPSSCPTDMPVTSLTVHRESRSTSYVDQRAACGGGSTPAVESTLAALLQTVDEIASAARPDSCQALGGECKHSPTDVTFPALCMQDFGTATLPGKCGAINEACCAKPSHCPPTGLLCTLDCPNTGHINGVPCMHGEFDEHSCQCLLVGP